MRESLPLVAEENLTAVRRRFRSWDSLARPSREALHGTATARARALEPTLNAYVAFAEGVAPRAAGRLEGMPYAAKDIFATPNRKPLCGLAAPVDLTDNDADVLCALDEAGGIRVGYTGLTELAFEPSGYNAVAGRVRNPWNTDFISGGSSSGSAAAVASGSAVVALGSDTAGSLRIPAHACGVTAWKPTHGTVSMRGTMPLAPTLDTVGLLARSVADMMPAIGALAPDLPQPAASIGKIVIARDALQSTHPALRKACLDGIDAVEASGVTLESRDVGSWLEACESPVFAIVQAEAARCHRAQLAGAAISSMLRRRLVKGLDIDDASLAAAVAMRAPLATDFVEHVLRDADAVLLPVMAIRTPLAAECDPDDDAFDARTLYALSRFTRFVNMLGLPSVAFPVGFDDRSMPVALQLVGRANDDLTLLARAASVQRRTDWHGRVPDAVAATVTAIDAHDIQ